MRVVAVIASYGRKNILDDAVKCIANQVSDVIIVGSSNAVEGTMLGCQYEKEFAESHNLIYVDHKNSPLGQKWQAGLNRARELQPDAVLICGSDDLISDGWVLDYINCKYVSVKKTVLYGTREWYVYNALTDEMITCNYRTREDVIGAGRIISKELLDLLDWQIFPTEGGIGCDLYSYNKMIKHDIYQMTARYDKILLCVKAAWHCLDSWQQLLSAQSLNISWVHEDEKQRILNNVFLNVDFGRYK